MKSFLLALVLLGVATPVFADPQLKRDLKGIFQNSKSFVKHVIGKTAKKVKKVSGKVENKMAK